MLKTDYGQQEAIAVFGRDPRLFTTTVQEILKDEEGRVRALRIGETIAPGVPWTETLLDPANPGAPHLALALKSGNFGGEDFFMQALGLLANAN